MSFVIEYEQFGNAYYLNEGPEPTERWRWAPNPGHATEFKSEAEAQVVVSELQQEFKDTVFNVRLQAEVGYAYFSKLDKFRVTRR
jgi:hypothetical protein